MLTLVVVMVSLGFWQLRRLDDKRDRNDLIERHLDEAPVPIEDVTDLADARFVRVTVTGEYVAGASVANRTLNGLPGEWQVGIMTLADGREVAISRGFSTEGDSIDGPADGEVRVTGYVIPRARLDRAARTDLDSLFDDDGVLPVLVQQTESDPSDSLELDLVPPPALDEGPHFGYAVQWFIFATVALVGYPLALRRIVQRRGKDLSTQDPESEGLV